MTLLLRVLHGVILLGLIAAAGMFAYEAVQGGLLGGGPIWSMAIFWITMTLGGVQLCLSAASMKRLVVLMWASVPMAVFTIGLIIMQTFAALRGAGDDVAMFARWASSGFFFIWMLGIIGSVHRLVVLHRGLIVLRTAADLAVVLTALGLLALIWWSLATEIFFEFTPLRARRWFELIARLSGALAIVATLLCITLVVFTKRRELTGEADAIVTERHAFTAACPRCGHANNLQTGGDVCVHCRLRITVNLA